MTKSVENMTWNMMTDHQHLSLIYDETDMKTHDIKHMIKQITHETQTTTIKYKHWLIIFDVTNELRS